MKATRDEDVAGDVLKLLGEDGLNTLRTGSFKLFKHPLPEFLTILNL